MLSNAATVNGFTLSAFTGKKVSVYDTDSTKYDAIKTGEKTCGTTPKQALAVLYRKATR